jgi:two-component system CheB/CheR fusion protein
MVLLADEFARARADAAAAAEPGVLVEALRAIASARDLAGVMSAVRRAARRLAAADGATFVLREGPMVHYADEDAISPLWKGRRFPAEACISGWAMLHRESVAIEDIYEDPRIPHDAYRPTFVRSLAMVPIRREDPLGAIGVYWARPNLATRHQLATLEALAEASAVAVANADLLAGMERSIRLRDEFIALAAHELNTPLAAVRLRTEALGRAARRAGEEAELAPELERLRGTLDRLTDVVGGLLAFSRASRDGIPLSRAQVDLGAVTEAAVAGLRARAEATGTELRVAAAPRVTGEWDGPRLGHAIAHLVENALKFGRGRPVDVTVEEGIGDARVVVRDRGPGVAPDARERIFEKYERAASADHVGGLGLGLWMARAIAEAHGGTVAIDAAAAEGATFVLTVPKRLPLERWTPAADAPR